MRIKNECIPCVSRQLVELAEKLTQDPVQQEDIILQGLAYISQGAFQKPASELTGMIYNYAKEVTGNQDPFRDEKTYFNQVALDLIEKYKLKQRIEMSDSPLETAIRLAIAGNIIDFSLGHEIKASHVDQAIEECLQANLFGDALEELIEAIESFESIVVIGDNAGEIVFDQLLVNLIKAKDLVYVVKGGPIVNDATIEDALSIGLNNQARLMDTGMAYQGVVLSQGNQEFLDLLDGNHLVISKGQANYECLNDLNIDNLYFLLRAKCSAVANEIGCKKMDFVCIKNSLS